MRSGYSPGILAGACLLLSGCDSLDPTTGDPVPDQPSLNEAIKVVGADWVGSHLAWKDTGGPTIVPPKVTSNSSKSFDIELAEVDAGYTLEDVAQLAIAIEGFAGHYVFDVGTDDRTPAGSILVTIVQEQPVFLPGSFTLQVIASDAEGSELAIDHVNAAFFAASAGDDSMAAVGETVALAATFTGETGSTQVTWSQVAGPDATIADASAADTTFVPETVGTYVMKLEAVDASGVVDVDLVSILVVDAFTVDAGEPKVITVDEEVTLYGLAGGGAGQASFTWTEVSEHRVTIENADSRIATFVAPQTGEYKFELRAIDDISGEASDRVVYLAFVGLTARVSAPAQAEKGETIQLQGQAGGGLLPYAFRWSQTSGPLVEIEDKTNQTALATLPVSGTYVFELRVEDSTAEDASAQVTVIVADECDDGDPCTTDIRDVDTGECLNDALVCDDGNFCTTDTCDAELGCIFENNMGECDDEDACTENDVCSEGTCAGAAKDCDDGNLCTTDTCDGELGCIFESNMGECDDEDACTENDVCSEGTCTGTAKDCDDGNVCTTDTCDTELGCVFTDIVCEGDRVCVEGVCLCTAAADCDDGNECTTDTCNVVTGECSNDALVCVDENLCTTDTCDTELGCVFKNIVCEGGEVCAEGECPLGPFTIHSGETLTGSIDPRADVDTYMFNANAGDTVIIQMSRMSGNLDSRIDLYPPSGGAKEASAGSITMPLADSPVALLQGHQLAESGLYTIVAKDVRGTDTGAYSLSLTVIP